VGYDPIIDDNRPPTASERIASSRKEVDDATAGWQAAVAELETLEHERDSLVAPIQQKIDHAARQVAWHKNRVREAIQRLDASHGRSR
jgi:hypothetical protein